MKKILMILIFSLCSLFAFEELNMNTFEQKVSKGGNVIVDFHAIW